jgi:hypothetical protein
VVVEEVETKAFLDRDVRSFGVCSTTLRDWRAGCLHALTVMELCSLTLPTSYLRMEWVKNRNWSILLFVTIESLTNSFVKHRNSKNYTL